MAKNKRKSKKPSGVNSRQPENRPVLFIDRSLGRHILADHLRAAGIPCEVHDDHLPQDATDAEWLHLVGKNRWIAIGRDKIFAIVDQRKLHSYKQMPGLLSCVQRTQQAWILRKYWSNALTGFIDSSSDMMHRLSLGLRVTGKSQNTRYSAQLSTKPRGSILPVSPASSREVSMVD